MKINVLQTNLGRKQDAFKKLLDETMKEKDIDVAIVSEANDNIVKELISNKDGLLCMCNDSESIYHLVAIIINNKSHPKIQMGNGTFFVWVMWENYLIIGCYIPPNVDKKKITKEEYEEKLRSLEKQIKSLKKTSNKENLNIILGGDFNAKSYRWGSPKEDTFGKVLANWFDQMDLEIVNTGDSPTFNNGNWTSFIDITACSSFTLTQIENWYVDNERVNLSDHRDIIFTINTEKPKMCNENIIQHNVIKTLLNEREVRSFRDLVYNLDKKSCDIHIMSNITCDCDFNDYYQHIKDIIEIYSIVQDMNKYNILMGFDIRHIEQTLRLDLFNHLTEKNTTDVRIIKNLNYLVIVGCATEDKLEEPTKNAVNEIGNWLTTKKQLQLNSQKVKAILFGEEAKKEIKTQIGELTIETQTTFNYRGFVFNKSMTLLDFGKHLDKFAEVTRSNIMRDIIDFPKKTQLVILECLVASTISFCAPIYKEVPKRKSSGYLNTLYQLRDRIKIKTTGLSKTVLEIEILERKEFLPIGKLIDTEWAKYRSETKKELSKKVNEE